MTDQLKLTSPAFNDGEDIPAKYTSDGENINPSLKISGVDEAAKSLVLIIDDPDAATDPDGPGKTFDHWVVFNIPTEITEIDENSFPKSATIGLNGINRNSYIGPAPPNGKHRYFFKLYELSDHLELAENSSKADVETAMAGKILSQTQLLGLYQRPV